MLPFLPYPFLVGCGLLLILLIHTWRRNHSRPQLLFLGLFWFYLLLAIRQTLFPIFPGDDWRQPFSEILSHINLRPFYFGGLFGPLPHLARLEIIGNILLTVPFGFLLPLVMRIRARHLPWLLLIGGFGFETGQLIINLVFGGNFRSVDINDVILNTTGALVGYGLFRLFGLVIRLVSAHVSKAPTGLWAYVLEVTKRK
jgi:glycopeptide antibiotics resistance protein